MLDAGDNVRITVFDQANLTNTYAVDQAGYVAFPLIGSVAARGKTAKQLEAQIAAQLSKVSCALRTSPSRSTATGRSLSWAKSARPANTHMSRA